MTQPLTATGENMPGTTYTAEPSSATDGVGRLADFARYAVAELGEIGSNWNGDSDLATLANKLEMTAREIASRLPGFTTADE